MTTTVVGEVRGYGGEPIAGAPVRYLGASTLTADDGSFTPHLCSGPAERDRVPAMNRGRQEADVLCWVRELRAGIAVEDNSRRLFERFYDWTRGFFIRRGFSAQETEDLAQDTFSQVFREIATFREESSFEGWFFAVAANVSRNERRRRETAKRVARTVSLTPEEGESGPDPPVDPASREASPERAVYDKQRRGALRRTIDGMPPQMRRCLVLRLDRELKYREIATLLKMNLDTVKAHLFNARQRLKEAFGEDLGEWNE